MRLFPPRAMRVRSSATSDGGSVTHRVDARQFYEERLACWLACGPALLLRSESEATISPALVAVGAWEVWDGAASHPT